MMNSCDSYEFSDYDSQGTNFQGESDVPLSSAETNTTQTSAFKYKFLLQIFFGILVAIAALVIALLLKPISLVAAIAFVVFTIVIGLYALGVGIGIFAFCPKKSSDESTDPDISYNDTQSRNSSNSRISTRSGNDDTQSEFDNRSSGTFNGFTTIPIE